ncbi:MAG: phosphate acyltransferase PlsX [Candidatus Porifericomitaceae bacterium WSBS_2022_MAG_OTU9]
MAAVRLAVDAMGGDLGPQVIVHAIQDALAKHKDLQVSCVGDCEQLRKLSGIDVYHPRLQLVHAESSVSMDDPPLHALRRKRNNSSMGMALSMLQNGTADACISAGNTGALTAMACYILKTISGIDRPALCTMMPNVNGSALVLDLGANIEATEQQLLQFAVMGSSLATVIYGDDSPSVALLNIGTETHKGFDYVQRCDSMLRASNINYCGYAEANDIFTGNYKVIVCDGYSGNIALKAGVGVTRWAEHSLRSVGHGSLWGKFSLLLAMPMLSILGSKIDSREYNGASLLGLRGVVVKSRGSADRKAFLRAMEHGISEVKENLLQKIQGQLESTIGKVA